MTVEEAKTIKDKVQKAYTMHKEAYENWPHGQIKKYHVPDDPTQGEVIVTYDDGMYFHYKFNQGGELIFW